MKKVTGSPHKLALAILEDWRRRRVISNYALYDDHILARESVLLEDIGRHLRDYRESGAVEVEGEGPNDD